MIIIPDILSTAQGKESDVSLKCNTLQCNSLNYSKKILPKIYALKWSLNKQPCLIGAQCYTLEV